MGEADKNLRNLICGMRQDTFLGMHRSSGASKSPGRNAQVAAVMEVGKGSF